MSKAARQQSARERLREERRRQETRQRTMRRLLIAASAVVVVAIAVGVGIFVQGQRAQSGGEFAGNLPAAKKVDGTIQYAAGGGGKPTVTVIEDFQCPYCKQFEDRSGAMLKRLAAQGKAKVVYNPVAIIDERSVRSGSAALCAADQGKFMPYHDILFAKQPPEQPVQGFTPQQLQQYGDQVGIDAAAFDKCVKQGQYRQTITQNTREASQKQGFSGTPTIFINGQKFNGDIFSPDSLEQAILSAGNSN